MQPAIRAFTLVELLVVIAIISVLAALTITGANLLRTQARSLDTTQRIEGVLSALRQCGMAGRTPAEVLNESVIAPWGAAQSPPVGTGVLRFQVSIGRAYNDSARSSGGLLVPESGAGTWLTANSFLWNSPWGRPRLTTDGGLGPTMDGYTLAQLNPRATPRFLAKAGVLDDVAQWPGDAATHPERRRAARSWNDAWGNPLVVAFAFFQPGVNTTVQTTWQAAGNALQSRTGIFPDLFVRQAKGAYGFNRAVYVTVGAVGPRLRSPPLPDDANAQSDALWAQLIDTCAATEWTAEGWTTPPAAWRGGVRIERRGGERCFLSLPVELR